MALLPLDSIRIDGGTQSRVEIDYETVDRYAEAMSDGAPFPAIIVFDDGASKWLADGFHRYHAAKQIKRPSIEAEVREGSQWDAVLFSVGANSGKERTDEDKRKCVYMLLDSGREEWLVASDNALSKQCHISCHSAGKYKADWSSLHRAKIPTTRTVTRNGKTYEQDTSNIGKSRKPQSERAEEEAPVSAQEPNTEAQPETNERREVGPTCRGMQFARLAVMRLEEIPEDDAERKEALEYVAEWIKGQTK